LACVRKRKAQRCFCLSEAKGKNREPGLQKNPVRDFIGRRLLSPAPFKSL
jgi:hypothetical protein